ncbi:uncharacterized protein K02A2.6-like [Macrosteles quadrilineatus]|uniref:uncharacterized protein K02A2.6-like n=1 Tax=Macrosteles quadrilineatus TaxID=74068 RepID=UPI0023E34EB8|nr:uncharacterized protein K02A2.6-like [Macrosteles quadrilineatus]
MAIDSGAVVSVMPEDVFLRLYQGQVPKLRESKMRLKTYTGQCIEVLGEFQANVSAGDESHVLPLVVVRNEQPNQPSLLGRNWLARLKLNWREIMRNWQPKSGTVMQLEGRNVPYTSTSSVEDLKSRFPTVFEPGIGTIRDIKVNLVLKENANPVFCKARNVPYALQDALEKEIDNLIRNEVMYPVTQTNWATPVVLVEKGNNSIRICGDFKQTINPQLRTDYYPLPTPDEIFAKIDGSKLFSKIDLSAAYNQLRVDENSQELLTINTTKGLFRYSRLPFGVTSAGAIFQSVMDKILNGLDRTFCYLDDILIVAQTHEEMHRNVVAVLSRLEHYGVKINPAKSEFFKDSLIFLGHRLSENKIQPSEELSKAIVSAPRPENVTQLRSYLGLINYYSKYLNNLSNLLQPLYGLLNKGVKWGWSEQCEEAFQKSKELLLGDRVLIPYDPKLKVIVSADASPYGVGPVISHQMPDGSERPIAYASRTLTVHEVKYSQIEKEALALVFAVKKFHIFLYGKKFLLATDHRPLTFLLGPTRSIPTLAAARVQRWALILSAYEYEIVYKKGCDMANADGLSRLPCQNEKPGPENTVAFFSIANELPVTAKEISTATRYDPILSKVLDFTIHGWPEYVSNELLKPYVVRSHELSVDGDCVLWGRRVIIPEPYRKEILFLLHKEHPGGSRMKNLARGYVWWPKMDSDIEELVKGCGICQSTRNALPLAPLQRWSWPNQPWQRVHVDFASFHNKEFLILVDSYSKWLEVFQMQTTTSAKTIERLRSCFAVFGLPCTLVSDGGPQLRSQEFEEFLKANGILHVVSPPYHPASNGLAERAVQTTKNTFLRQMLQDEMSKSNRSVQHRIDSFLFVYRNTP